MQMPNPKRKPVDDWRERSEVIDKAGSLGMVLLLLTIVFVAIGGVAMACSGTIAATLASVGVADPSAALDNVGFIATIASVAGGGFTTMVVCLFSLGILLGLGSLVAHTINDRDWR